VPELQRLELLGKTALAVVKYLPLPASLAAGATDVLVSAPTAEPWSARAAALVFAQYFWFRHSHLLSREDDDRLQVRVQNKTHIPYKPRPCAHVITSDAI